MYLCSIYLCSLWWINLEFWYGQIFKVLWFCIHKLHLYKGLLFQGPGAHDKTWWASIISGIFFFKQYFFVCLLLIFFLFWYKIRNCFYILSFASSMYILLFSLVLYRFFFFFFLSGFSSKFQIVLIQDIDHEYYLPGICSPHFCSFQDLGN